MVGLDLKRVGQGLKMFGTHLKKGWIWTLSCVIHRGVCLHAVLVSERVWPEGFILQISPRFGFFLGQGTSQTKESNKISYKGFEDEVRGTFLGEICQIDSCKRHGTREKHFDKTNSIIIL